MTKPNLRRGLAHVRLAHRTAASDPALAKAHLARAAKIFAQCGETELAQRCKELSRR